MFEEDLSAFFELDEFANTAIYTPPGGGAAVPGVVIYDRNGVILETQDVQTSSPAARVPTEQWPGVREGGTVAIAFADGTETFVIRSAMPQDDGAVTILALQRT